MQLRGNHVINASPEIIWNMLIDPDILASIVPGIEKIEKTGDNTFKSTVVIKLGPVNSSFTGSLQMDDLEKDKGFTLKVQQNSKVGNANAVVKIDLAPVSENQATVSFDGNVKLSGLLASMGQRVLGSVANMLSKQFFTNMEKEIKAMAPISNDLVK
jgi:carbon monoxide dehydrogenase subunit G